MGTTRTIAKNTFMLTFGLLVGRVLAVFILKKMTPILGPAGLGIWGLATDLTTILLVIANFGLGPLITREVIRDRELTLRVLWSSLRVRWVIGAVCYAFLIVYVHATGLEPLSQAAVLITGVAIFVEATSMSCDAILQAHDRFEYQAAGQFASAVVYFGLAFWWLAAGGGLMGVIWANLASRVARLAVMVPLMLARTGPWRWRLEGEAAASTGRLGFGWMMRLGLPLFLSTTFGIVSYKIDVVMLMEMLGKTATGIYVLGHRALDVLLMIPNIFATAFYPAMARYAARGLAGDATGDPTGGQADAARLAERALRYMLLLILPLTLFIALVAPPVIRWFDRAGEFPASILVLQIVIWGLPFQAANTVFNRVLIAGGRERVFMAIALVALTVNVMLNLLFIPRYGYYGAGTATVISLAASCGMHYGFIVRARLRLPWTRAVLGTTGALLMAWLGAVAVVRLLAPSWGATWWSLPLDHGWGPFLAMGSLTAVFYAALAFGLRILRADDLGLVRQLLKGNG